MIALKHTLHNLTDLLSVKLFITFVYTSLVAFFTNSDVIYFMVFTLLVVVDVITKNLSLGAQYVADERGAKVTDVPFTAKAYGVILAFNAGIIKSITMRDKITSKLGTYLIIIVASILTDSLCTGIEGNGEYILYKLSVAYLGATEFLSILENLRDGGNPLAEKLLTVARKKLDKTF